MTAALPLLTRTVRESSRSLVLWCLGVLAALALYIPLYPSIGGNADMRNLIDQLPAELVRTIGYQDIASGPGYVQSTFFGLMGFVLVTIASVAWGTASIAGEEESGALELTLAHAVTRARVVLEAAAALALRLLVVVVVAVLALLVFNGPAGTELDTGNLLATALAYYLLAVVPGLAALAAGALTGRRPIALGAGAGIAVLSYALNAVGNQSDDLGWLRHVSPYGWAYQNTPLASGADWGGIGLLAALDVVLLAIAYAGLRARDIGV